LTAAVYPVTISYPTIYQRFPYPTIYQRFPVSRQFLHRSNVVLMQNQGHSSQHFAQLIKEQYIFLRVTNYCTDVLRLDDETLIKKFMMYKFTTDDSYLQQYITTHIMTVLKPLMLCIPPMLHLLLILSRASRGYLEVPQRIKA